MSEHLEHIVITERPDSRFWRGGAVERVYNVLHTDEDLLAIEALAAHELVPAVYDDVLLRQWPPDLEPVGPEQWRATVRYAPASSSTGGSPTESERFSFEIGGATARITQALATTRYPNPGAPDTGRAIGVQPDGTVEGVDRNVKTSQFTIVKFQPAAVVTEAYQLLLETMAWTVNSATFRGRAAGEVLFMGASGTDRPAVGDFEIHYRFARRENRTGVVIPNPAGADITGISVDGWQYMEVRHDRRKAGDDIVPAPVGVYVHTNYPSSNFSNLLL